MNLIKDLRIARSFLQDLEESLDKSDKDWFRNSEVLAHIRYGLGRVKTDLENSLYIDVKRKSDKRL